ncbi:MAG: hypothetical protein H7X84_02540 [Verrucomicrobia bacterium]|nr:hypothetical protein [Prolixibacteraceae bacterium]
MPDKHTFISKELLISLISIPSLPVLQGTAPGMIHAEQALQEQGTFIILIN